MLNERGKDRKPLATEAQIINQCCYAAEQNNFVEDIFCQK